MTVARSQIVDVSVTSWYHVISKTVRGARLLCDGELDRKQWIEDRLEVLAGVFAVEIGGFAILDNHLHLLVNLQSAQIDNWSDEEVLARWYRIHPPRLNRQPVEITPELLERDGKRRDMQCAGPAVGWLKNSHQNSHQKFTSDTLLLYGIWGVRAN